ncbi:MAG: 2-phosphosulfolactate phosphatase [Bacteroidetes bacterium]|nr:2-phosphosulfolactate phosphatase [Bacteroidota bacterium]
MNIKDNNSSENNRIPRAEVVLSPALLPHYNLTDKTVVVIDVFRASSAICTAIAHGVKEIIPVQTLEEAYEYKQNGYVVAAERNGEVVSGFDFGNSPYSFMSEDLKGKSIVLTTSNFTKAIHQVVGADKILIGSFLNISAVCEYLIQHNEDVVLLCSGWKNKANIEDTVFAGAVISRIKEYFSTQSDAALIAEILYKSCEDDLPSLLKNTSHSHRLSHLNLEKDIDYCLIPDQLDVIPVYKRETIVSLTHILV